jgi:hypothetical protein
MKHISSFDFLYPFCYPLLVLSHMRVGGCCKVANKYSGSFAPSRWFPPALKHGSERRWVYHQLNSVFSSSVSHAHSKWLPSTCCSVSYSHMWQSFNSEYCSCKKERGIYYQHEIHPS